MSETNGQPLSKAWDSATLSDVCWKIVDGSHNPPPELSRGWPMLSAKNITDGHIEFDGRLIDPILFAKENHRTNVQPGDILLTIVGSIGRAAVVPNGIPAFTLQRSVAVLKSCLPDPRFLMYQFQSQ